MRRSSAAPSTLPPGGASLVLDATPIYIGAIDGVDPRHYGSIRHYITKRQEGATTQECSTIRDGIEEKLFKVCPQGFSNRGLGADAGECICCAYVP